MDGRTNACTLLQLLDCFSPSLPLFEEVSFLYSPALSLSTSFFILVLAFFSLGWVLCRLLQYSNKYLNI